MSLRRLRRALVTGFVAFVTGEPEVFDPVRTAERQRKSAAEHQILQGSRGSAQLTERPESAHHAAPPKDYSVVGLQKSPVTPSITA